MIHAIEVLILLGELAILAGLVFGGVLLFKRIKRKRLNRKNTKTQVKETEQEKVLAQEQTKQKTKEKRIQSKKSLDFNKIAKKCLNKNFKQKKFSVQKSNPNIFRTAENYEPSEIARKNQKQSKAGFFEGNVEPSFVKNFVDAFGHTIYDKRTYIQCYNKKTADEFEKSVKQNDKDEVEFPCICQINFNKESGKAPLIVSATNKQVLEDGISQILLESKNIIQNSSNKNVLFPIKVMNAQEYAGDSEIYKNEKDYLKYVSTVCKVKDDEKYTDVLSEAQKQTNNKNGFSIDDLFEQ